MSTFLNDLVKNLGDDFTTLASEITEDESFIDSGSYIFNGLISGSVFGGVSGNKITAIAQSIEDFQTLTMQTSIIQICSH